MRAFQRLLMATPSSIGSKANLGPAPLALLPPIPLYRRILRLHRTLPPELRLLGDEYVKSEFRAHRNVENPIHIVRLIHPEMLDLGSRDCCGSGLAAQSRYTGLDDYGRMGKGEIKKQGDIDMILTN